MKTIELTRNMVTQIDDADYELVSDRRWFALHGGRGKFYAASGAWIEGKYKLTLMHRLLLNAPEGVDVDHINGNSLDNRRENLRLATKAQNQANRGRPVNNTTGFRGVYFVKATGKWRAEIKINKRRFHLGTFSTPEAAARAYDAKMVEAFGEFAVTNFPK